MFKDLIFKENCVVHCPEKWMAKKLLEYAHDKGYMWFSRDSYLDVDLWVIEKENTCYDIYKGQSSRKEYYNNIGKSILNFYDVYLGELTPSFPEEDEDTKRLKILKNFYEAMTYFNFIKVEDVMTYLEWEWHDIGIPTEVDMKESLEKNIKDMIDNNNVFFSSGGFKITICEDLCVNIEFVVEEWLGGEDE